MATKCHARLCALSKVFLQSPLPSRISRGATACSDIPSFLLPARHDRAYTTLKRSRTPLESHSRQIPPVHCFSTSSRTSATVINPIRDEDGQELTLTITERCFKRLAHLASLKKPKTVLRINVLSGGCHGFEYTRELVPASSINLGNDGSNASAERVAGGSSAEEAEEEPVLDTVFEAEDGTGAKVVVDHTSLELLKGATVDYTIELMGSEFVVRDIPGASSSCGCGTSFSLKI